MADTPTPYPDPAAARRDTIYAVLRDGNAGRPCMTPGAALALVVPLSGDAEDAARQRISRGRYPYRLTHVGGYRVVMLADIADALAAAPTTAAAVPNAEHSAPAEPADTTGYRRPGRPRKNRNVPGVAHD